MKNNANRGEITRIVIPEDLVYARKRSGVARTTLYDLQLHDGCFILLLEKSQFANAPNNDPDWMDNVMKQTIEKERLKRLGLPPGLRKSEQ